MPEQKVTPVQDDFLDGFHADDRTSWYTGKWEPVQADTAGSGLQIHARQKQPKPHTDAALQTAYEEAKRYYESIRDELEQTANENRMDTPWYDVLSSEYGPALEQYRELEEQYTARQKELEVSKQLAEDFARSHKYTLPTGNREYDREKARLKKSSRRGTSQTDGSQVSVFSDDILTGHPGCIIYLLPSSVGAESHAGGI